MAKFYVKTYGCSLNVSDSETITGLLVGEGHELVGTIGEAEVLIVNSCTVKGPSESSLLKDLKQNSDKKIIIAGCVPKAQMELGKYEGYSIIGPESLTEIPFIFEETLKGNTIVALDPKDERRVLLPGIRKNRIVEIIPICKGCLGAPCSYCKTWYARGTLKSYPKQDVIQKAQEAIENGAKEIWLTAQDTGCYGMDIGSSIVELLQELTKLEGDFKIRLGMMNPNHIKHYLKELMECYQNEKMFKFIHIPVQSGNNRILKAMKRKYTVEEFKDTIKKMREHHEDITISTDMIVGFPTETRQEFEDSLWLIREIKPDVLNISRYWKREGTQAASMKQVRGSEIKDRSRVLTMEFWHLAEAHNEKWFGWEGELLIDEKGKNGTMIGRNYTYKQIIISDDVKIGDKVRVKITSTTKHYLRGEKTS